MPNKMSRKDFEGLLFGIVAGVLGLTAVVVLVGSGLNSHGLKYLRSGGFNHCNKGVLVLNLEGSHYCCDRESAGAGDWICLAAFDRLNKFLTSDFYAIFIPMFPLFWNVAEDFVSRLTWMKKGISRFSPWVHLKRALVYASIVFFRVTILYLIPMKIQTAYSASLGVPLSEDCWYKEYVSNHRCRDGFDFSDHIVLNIVQYTLPVILELHYTFYRHRILELPSLSASLDTSSSSAQTANNSKPSGWFANYIGRWMRFLAVGIPVLIIAVNCRSMFLTAMFFHTPLENGIGYIVGASVAFLPLLTKTGQSWWMTVILSTVDNEP